EYLRALPLSISRTVGNWRLRLVHATPWSIHDVVLPDAPDERADRMSAEGDADLLLYGHIHTPYTRVCATGMIASVGAVNGSNDQDPRPAYVVLTVASDISMELRRVDWEPSQRLEAYRQAGIDEEHGRNKPGPLPIRWEAGHVVTVRSSPTPNDATQTPEA